MQSIQKTNTKNKDVKKSHNDLINFTYIGTIYNKDLTLLFDSFQNVLKKNQNTFLNLIGFDKKYPKKIPMNINILPRIPYKEFIKYIQASDIFLLPLKCSTANISRYPSKVGDYISIGRPIISTPHPEIVNIVKQAKCGYIAKDDSIYAFSEAMIHAIKDKNSWNLLGKNAINYAKQNLSWDIVCKNIIAFYKKNLEKNI